MNVSVDTKEYVTVLKEMVDNGMEVSMIVTGTSMEPFLIHNRDRIYFKKPEGSLKNGDMVFFQRKTGEYVMHRIIKAGNKNYYLAGDHQTCLEGPIEETQIFAKVVSVERAGIWLSEENLSWKFYAVLWRRLFLLRKVVNKLKRVFCI